MRPTSPIALDELRRLTGQRVTLRLQPHAPGAPTVTGRLLGVLDALDGLVVTIEPDGAPETRMTCHYHYILAITPESQGG
jgi:hypothetical protein